MRVACDVSVGRDFSTQPTYKLSRIMPSAFKKNLSKVTFDAPQVIVASPQTYPMVQDWHSIIPRHFTQIKISTPPLPSPSLDMLRPADKGTLADSCCY